MILVRAKAVWCPGVVRGNRTARLQLLSPEEKWCPRVMRENRTGGKRRLERAKSDTFWYGQHAPRGVYVTGEGELIREQLM